MHSPFDPQHQNQHHDIESKIISALDRIATAYRVIQWNKGKELSLSPIQLQVLTFLSYHTPQLCTVTALAAEFDLSKATMSEVVKALEAKGLISKSHAEADARSYHICLTAKGMATTAQVETYADALQQPLRRAGEVSNAHLLEGLLGVILELHQAGIITVQRMCQTCVFFQAGGGGNAHHCKFLQQDLETATLRLDCPEHQRA